MNRRGFLRTAGAAIGGAGGAIALTRSADSADAQTAIDFTLEGDSVTVGATESITAVWLDVTVDWAVALPETILPESTILTVVVDGEEVATDTSAQLFSEDDGSETFSIELLDAGVLEAGALRGTKTEVEVTVRMRVEDSNSEAIAKDSQTKTATLTIDAEGVEASEYGRVGGAGALTIETDGE